MSDEVTGKAKGGKARAEVLTPERRKEIAREGARARWSEPTLPTYRATHLGQLKIGNIDCAVLEDKTRVLTRVTFVKAIGRTGKAKGGRAYDDEFKLPVFLTAKNLEPFISNDLLENSKPMIYKYKKQQFIGYKAILLPQVCGVFIDADEAGVLTAAWFFVGASSFFSLSSSVASSTIARASWKISGCFTFILFMPII